MNEASNNSQGRYERRHEQGTRRATTHKEERRRHEQRTRRATTHKEEMKGGMNFLVRERGEQHSQGRYERRHEQGTRRATTRKEEMKGDMNRERGEQQLTRKI